MSVYDSVQMFLVQYEDNLTNYEKHLLKIVSIYHNLDYVVIDACYDRRLGENAIYALAEFVNIQLSVSTTGRNSKWLRYIFTERKAKFE